MASSNRLPGEDLPSYLEFRAWLEGPAPRPLPPPHALAWASTWDWTSRARAWDTEQASSPQSPAEWLARAHAHGSELVAREIAKYLAGSKAVEDARLSPEQIVRMWAVLKGMQEQAGASGADDMDRALRDMTPEERELATRLARKLVSS